MKKTIRKQPAPTPAAPPPGLGRRQFLWLAAGLAAGLTAARAPAAEDISRQFEYDLDRYRTVDPALIVAAQTRTLDPGLAKLAAVAVTADDHLFVAGEGALGEFDAAGERLRQIPVAGRPHALAAAGDDGGLLLVGDRTVTRLGADGAAVAVADLGEGALLCSAVADGPDIFVADAGSKLVWRISGSGPAQAIRCRLENGEEERFILPSRFFDLAPAEDDGFWVVNAGRHRIVKMRPDGRMVAAWGEASIRPEGFAGCCNPAHLTRLPDGSFVTAEKGLPRVKLYGPDGAFRGVIADANLLRDDAGGLDLAADGRGQIYVLDPPAGVVRVFKLK